MLNNWEFTTFYSFSFNRFLDFRLILWFSITSTRYLVMYLKYLMCKTWQIEIASIILFGLVIFKKSISCADGCSNPFSLHRMPMVRRWCGGVMLVGTLSQNNNNNRANVSWQDILGSPVFFLSLSYFETFVTPG